MGPYSAPGHAPCGLNPSRCPGLAGENAAVVTSPALSAAETGAAEALLACVWGPGTSVRAAEPIWDRTHVVRLHLAAGRSRLGSISAHAGDVVDLGEGCADVVGQRVGAVRVWLADRPASRFDCPCRGREVGLVSRWCRSRSRREARASVVRHAGAGRRRVGSGRARRDLRRRGGQ